MKVTCQSCGAQYNLPDDKIRGRKAKVRCKKCSERIVVDGTALLGFDDEDEATRVMSTASFSESGDLLWTVNLSDDEQLDMTEAEVLDGWRQGRITDDAYVWREGMDEWMPILDAPALGDAIRAQDPQARAMTADASPAPTPATASSPFAAPTPATASSPFAAPTPATASSPFAAPTPASNPFAAPQPAAAEVPTPAAPVYTPPTGGVTPRPAVASRPSAPSPSSHPKPKSHRSEDTSKAFSFAL